MNTLNGRDWLNHWGILQGGPRPNSAIYLGWLYADTPVRWSLYDKKRVAQNLLVIVSWIRAYLRGKRTASLQLIGPTPRFRTLLITQCSRGSNIAKARLLNLRLDTNLFSNSNVTLLFHSYMRAGSAVREAVGEQAVFGRAALWSVSPLGIFP